MEGLSVTPETIQRQIAHQAAIAANFHENIQPLLADTDAGITLRPHQPTVLEEMDAILAETADEARRGLLVPMPPNFGKSFMTVLAMKLAGVGKVVAETGEPLRAISLTPRRLARQQTLETFSWLAPEIRVQKYDARCGPTAYDNVDVVAMNYAGVCSLSAEHWQRLSCGRDILALDEVHRAIGKMTASRIIAAQAISNSTIIASSATPSFSEVHSSETTFNLTHKTSRLTQRGAIELGISNEAQLFALYSGEKVFFDSKRQSITETDVLPLIEREGRNKLILDTIVDMAANGRPGIVQLIPGENSLHARRIAGAASEREFIDPSSGKKRQLIAKAVGSFNSDGTNKRIIEEFRLGRVDCLTFTRYLTEAFDCPLGYVFNACPLGSEVDIYQLAGRGARAFPRPTVYLTLVDQYGSYSYKRVWSFFDVFGEDQIYQGRQIHKNQTIRKLYQEKTSGGNRERQDRNSDTALPEIHFSPQVQAALDKIPPGTVLDEALIVKTSLQEVPPGYIPIHHLPSIQEGRMTPEGAQLHLASLATDDGRPLFRNIRSGTGCMRYVLAEEAEELIRTATHDPNRHVTRLEITNFLESQGWPRLSFDGFVTVCDDSGAFYKMSTSSMHMKPEDAKKFLMHLLETPFVDPEVEVSLGSIAQRIGKNFKSSELLRVMKANMNHYGEFLRIRRRGLPPVTYKEVQTFTIEGAKAFLLEMAERLSPVRRALDALAANRETAAEKLISLAQETVRQHYKQLGINPRLDKGAIEHFLGLYSLPIAPLPLNKSYALSLHGRDWRHYAACNGENPELFFPVGQEHRAVNQTQIRKAKKICAKCRVKGDCLLEALDHKSQGVAGGLSEGERRNLSKEARDWLRSSKPSPSQNWAST